MHLLKIILSFSLFTLAYAQSPVGSSGSGEGGSSGGNDNGAGASASVTSSMSTSTISGKHLVRGNACDDLRIEIGSRCCRRRNDFPEFPESPESNRFEEE